MIYFYITRNNRQQAAIIVSSIYSFPKKSSWKNTFRHVPFIFRILAISALILALARPQTRNDEELKTGEGIDIILCLDVSGSMLAQDFLPNRIEASKQMAADFVEMRPTDRIG